MQIQVLIEMLWIVLAIAGIILSFINLCDNASDRLTLKRIRKIEGDHITEGIIINQMIRGHLKGLAVSIGYFIGGIALLIEPNHGMPREVVLRFCIYLIVQVVVDIDGLLTIYEKDKLIKIRG